MSQSEEGDCEARQTAAQQMEALAVQAVQAVPTASAAPLWLAAYNQVAALGSTCKRLHQTLLRELTAMPTGPLRVTIPSVQLVAVIAVPCAVSDCQVSRHSSHASGPH